MPNQAKTPTEELVQLHQEILGRLSEPEFRTPCFTLGVNYLAFDQTALVGGDFNSHEATPQIGRTKNAWVDTFRHLHPHADGHTHVLRWPWGGALKRHRLDYIFLSPVFPNWQVTDARHLATPGDSHSDHHAVLAHLAPLS